MTYILLSEEIIINQKIITLYKCRKKLSELGYIIRKISKDDNIFVFAKDEFRVIIKLHKWPILKIDLYNSYIKSICLYYRAKID